MTDRIGAGRARIGDDLTRRGNADGLLRIDYRFLRRIISDPFWRFAQTVVPVQSAIIVLAERHSATGRADDSELWFEVRILGPQFRQRGRHHSGRPMQAEVLSTL